MHLLILSLLAAISVVPDLEPPPEISNHPPTFTPMVEVAAMPKEEIIERLQIVDFTIHDTIDLLAEITGKIPLTPSNLPDAPFNFDSKGPITTDEAVRAIETLLNMNGVSVIAAGDRFLRIVPASDAKFKAPNILEGSTLELRPSDRIYTKVFKLKYLTYDEVSQLISSIITPSYASQVHLAASNSLVVTDSLSNLQRIERMLSAVDNQSENIVIHHQIANTEANELKTKLDQAFQSTYKNSIFGTILVDADDRTNTLLISSDPKNEALINDLLKTLDANVDPITESEVFYIKYAESTEVVAILNDLVQAQKKTKNDSNRTNNQDNRNNLPPAEGQNRSTPQVDQTVLATNDAQNLQFSDMISVIADERSNAVIVYGTKSDIAGIESIINKIDILLAQVRIDVVITEVSLGNNSSRGLDKFGISYEDDVTSYGINEDSDLPINIEGTLLNLVSSSLTVSDFTLGVVFDTAKKDSTVSVISTPTLITTHNHEAEINAAESRPVITASSTDSTGLQTRSSVQFKDIGINLKVKPLIGSNGIVQMEITQKVENVVGEVLVDGNSQPIIGTREAKSFVSIKDGEILILGGLQENSRSKSKGKTSVLGSIPILGNWLFSSDREDNNIRELIIFIKPTVYHSPVEGHKDASKEVEDSENRQSLEELLDLEKTNASSSIKDSTESTDDAEILKKQLLRSRKRF